MIKGGTAFVDCNLRRYFLARSAKLRKTAISFVTSICPNLRLSVRIEKLISQLTDFHLTYYLFTFPKFVEIFMKIGRE